MKLRFMSFLKFLVYSEKYASFNTVKEFVNKKNGLDIKEDLGYRVLNDHSDSQIFLSILEEFVKVHNSPGFVIH